MQFSETAISLHPVAKNGNCITWGPNSYFSVAFENILYIYKHKPTEIEFIRSISRHKSNITFVRFNNSTLLKPDPLIAIGDETGNCLIYEVLTGKRFAGISPTTITSTSIVNIQWSPTDPSVVFILTSLPSILCFRLEHSSTEDESYITYNMSVIWSHVIRHHYQFMLFDPYNPNNLYIVNKQGQYFIFHLKSDFEKVSVSDINQIACINAEKMIGCEFFPFSKSKIVVVFPCQIRIFDLKNNESCEILSVSPQKNVYSTLFYSSEEFWVTTTEGISHLSLNDTKWMIDSGVLIERGGIVSSSTNPWDPSILAVVFSNGKVVLYKHMTKKIVAIGCLPGYSDSIASWCSFDDNIAFITNNNIVTVVTEDTRMRFVFDDKLVSSGFLGKGKLIVSGKYLYVVDLETREIERIRYYPREIQSGYESLAFTPLPNVVSIMRKDLSKETHIFNDNVKLLVPNSIIPGQWAVFFNSSSVLQILTLSSESITKKIVKIPEGITDVSCAVFYGDKMIISVPIRKAVYLFDVQKLHLSLIMPMSATVSSIKCCGESVIVLDRDLNCMLVKNGKCISVAKWRVLDAAFLNEDVAVIQTSRSCLRLVVLPDFATFGTKTEHKKEFFTHIETTSDLMQLATRTGDQEMVRFLRLLDTGKSTFYHYGVFSNKNEYIKAKRATIACTKQFTVEDLILSGRYTEAASLLLDKSDNQSVLLAYACLSQDKQALEKVLSFNKGNPELLSLLCAICGENESAINTLIHVGNFEDALTYSKYLLTDEEFKKISHLFSDFYDEGTYHVYTRTYDKAIQHFIQNQQIEKLLALRVFMLEHSIPVPYEDEISRIQQKYKL